MGDKTGEIRQSNGTRLQTLQAQMLQGFTALLQTLTVALWQRGGKLGALGLTLFGLSELGLGVLKRDFEAALHGLGWLGGGLALASLAFHGRRATQMIATTQAENKLQNPNLAPTSADSAVQREIDKQRSTAQPQTNGAAVSAAAAEKLTAALVSFDPAKLTPERILQAVTELNLFPGRIGSAIWINVLTGKPDKGAKFEIFEKDKIEGDLLIGHASAGAALGYQFARAGNVMASVFAGATHPYNGSLLSGWAPVAGAGIGFKF